MKGGRSGRGMVSGMNKLGWFKVLENRKIAKLTYILVLEGDCSAIRKPGQFVNIALPDRYLRRPFSVCTLDGDRLTLIYKILGEGTAEMADFIPDKELELITGLGNGFDTDKGGQRPLLVGGGVGVVPLMWLAEDLVRKGKKPNAVLGFGSGDEIFLKDELEALGVPVVVSTVDGSAGVKGFVTDAIKESGFEYDYIFTCGPEPMLKAVHALPQTGGQYSFEERMACGFGACMGCSCETKYGSKRICKEGPVLEWGEIIW